MSSIQSSRAGAPGARQKRNRKETAEAVDTTKPASKGHTRRSAKRESGHTRTAGRTVEAGSGETSEAGSEASSEMTAISPEQWRAMVAEAAYYRAQRRGFDGGSPEQDWLEAEEEIRRSLEER
jgi:hypothetical protein